MKVKEESNKYQLKFDTRGKMEQDNDKDVFWADGSGECDRT